MFIPESDDINKLSEKIIGCAYQVGNGLGSGFLEKVHENALVYELRKAGLRVYQQHPIDIFYDGIRIGEYFADLLVEGKIIIELKTVRKIDQIHLAQCMNYLRATGLHLCLLINFYSPKIEIRRVVLGLKE